MLVRLVLYIQRRRKMPRSGLLSKQEPAGMSSKVKKQSRRVYYRRSSYKKDYYQKDSMREKKNNLDAGSVESLNMYNATLKETNRHQAPLVLED